MPTGVHTYGRTGGEMALVEGASTDALEQIDDLVVAQQLIRGMGEVGVDLWEKAASAYVQRDPAASQQLRLLDDELADLHVRLTEELAGAPMSPAVAIELGLMARFYERLGDHAVNIGERIRYIAEGP